MAEDQRFRDYLRPLSLRLTLCLFPVSVCLCVLWGCYQPTMDRVKRAAVAAAKAVPTRSRYVIFPASSVFVVPIFLVQVVKTLRSLLVDDMQPSMDSKRLTDQSFETGSELENHALSLALATEKQKPICCQYDGPGTLAYQIKRLDAEEAKSPIRLSLRFSPRALLSPNPWI